MKKKKILNIFIALIVCVFTGLIIWFIWLFFFDKGIHDEFVISNTGAGLDDKPLNNEALIKSKLDIIRNRFRIKDIILKGDNYFKNEQLGLAIIQYRIALDKNPQDYKIIEKIGDIYLEMKDFDEAIDYYSRLFDIPGFDNTKYILALIYSKDLTDNGNVEYIKKELDKNIKDKEKAFFYKNALFCLEDFHTCKLNFDAKIESDKILINSKELIEIKNTLQTYKDFGLVDLYYKNSLVIGSFMKMKLYPISIELGKKLLEEKQDYKAIIQIISQCYFELGNYKLANNYLKKYFSLTPTDSSAAYMLGIINLKLSEYVYSNIFFTKALNLGYKDTINVKRKIAYNYYMLKQDEKMYKVFDEIITTEKNVTKDDINIMINYAIEMNQSEKVFTRTKKGIQLFPKEPLFYAYMGKIELDRGKNTLALLYVKNGLKIDPKSQMLTYVYGLINLSNGQKDIAKEYLQNAYDLNKKSSLAKEILNDLSDL